MLTFILALVVGLGSLGLYLAAFFYPELHRKGDLVWSGVGLFYALVLWVCAERITGGVLLGQMASVSLIGWLGWQTLVARSGQTRAEQRSTTGDLSTDLQAGLNRVLSPENTAKLKQQFINLRDRAQSLISKTSQPSDSAETQTAQTYEPLKPEDFGTPPTTVDAAASPATPTPQISSSTPTAPPASSPQSNPLTALIETAKSVIGSFNKPKKNTSTYVRKNFRDAAPSVQEEAVDFEEDDQNVPFGAPSPPPVLSDEDATSDSTTDSDEVMLEETEFEARRAAETATSETEGLQPIPPKPPTPDLVEAAIADAEEKHIPAHPPEPAPLDE